MSWIRVEAGSWQMLGPERKDSRCQIELVVADPRNVKGLPLEGESLAVAPIRTLSFDIECSAPADRFPDSTKDPVIQIANIGRAEGTADCIVRNVFTVRSCAPI